MAGGSDILAVDPGLMTGVAWWTQGRFGSDEIGGGLFGFVEWMLFYQYDHVVVEKFTIMASTTKKTRQYDALYLNGWLLGEGHKHATNVSQQLVTGVKKFATNDKLKKLGWYKGGAGHADDAARHLLTFIAKEPWAQPILERLI